MLILDYKTSAKIAMALGKLDPDDRDSWSAVSNCVQLPFYRMLYAQRFGVPAESISCAYIAASATRRMKRRTRRAAPHPARHTC
ncbi:MAG: hypothetical protein SFH39_15650 [Candidatus Magnetobacterium sp. LHC-1]|uniref:hypothetical protein n=1 Tax=Candidatus Magnetobacterium casense TaxID=1455061 RepID=UPI001A010BA0|nr:hypothetical protein [Candidatus Magnetobacterium casensis]MBF0607966.1 hypothetical protein [Nitrospirota bacterium]